MATYKNTRARAIIHTIARYNVYTFLFFTQTYVLIAYLTHSHTHMSIDELSWDFIYLFL